MANNAQSGNGRNGKIGCGGLIMMLILAAVIGGSCSKPEPPKDPNAWKTEDNSTMAYVMMQDFVKRGLKAPSTAKFPWMGDSQVIVARSKDQTYTVYGYVDAQNSFGALLRSEYTGVVRQVGEDQWELVNLKLNE